MVPTAGFVAGLGCEYLTGERHQGRPISYIICLWLCCFAPSHYSTAAALLEATALLFLGPSITFCAGASIWTQAGVAPFAYLTAYLLIVAASALNKYACPSSVLQHRTP